MAALEVPRAAAPAAATRRCAGHVPHVDQHQRVAGTVQRPEVCGEWGKRIEVGCGGHVHIGLRRHREASPKRSSGRPISPRNRPGSTWSSCSPGTGVRPVSAPAGWQARCSRDAVDERVPLAGRGRQAHAGGDTVLEGCDGRAPGAGCPVDADDGVSTRVLHIASRHSPVRAGEIGPVRREIIFEPRGGTGSTHTDPGRTPAGGAGGTTAEARPGTAVSQISGMCGGDDGRPLVAGSLRGYRTWRLQRRGHPVCGDSPPLTSVTRRAPGAPTSTVVLHAQVMATRARGPATLDGDHVAPAAGCQCGIYGWYDPPTPACSAPVCSAWSRRPVSS